MYRMYRMYRITRCYRAYRCYAGPQVRRRITAAFGDYRRACGKEVTLPPPPAQMLPSPTPML